MADLSDDISSLLHTLLQNSSQPSTSSCPSSTHQGTENRHPGSGVFSEPVGFFDPNFGFPGAYYTSGLSMDEINEADCESEGQEETRLNQPPPPRGSSSKRSRAAEVHNLSEKRRRQKINEKMKALQKLIPNSNKTDKASMLDEAIEYLKQLQLQVQMLTMRNGSSLHPYYLPGVAQPMQPPSVGELVDEANNSRGIASLNADQENPTAPIYDLDGKPGTSEFKNLMPRLSENHSGPSLALESSMMYRPFNSSMHSKVLCKNPALPQLQLDKTYCGQSSSSGVSS